MAERKTEKLSDAAEKTTAALQGLQTRLTREAAAIRSARPESAQQETADELGRQLEEYFASAPADSPLGFAVIRDEVIGKTVERILRAWEDPDGGLSASLKEAIIARLVERVLDTLQRPDRVAPDIL
jgi:hypothetical protein